MPDHDGHVSNPFKPSAEMACPCIFGDEKRCWCKTRPLMIGGHRVIVDERVRTHCGCDIMTINPSDWEQPNAIR